MLASFWEAFGTILGGKTHAKNSRVFSLKKVTRFHPKGTPKGPQGDPQIKDLGSRLAPSPPGGPYRIANGAKTSTFSKNVPKMRSKSVPHFANYGEINAESFVKRVVLLLEPANSFRQRRGSKDKFDEAKDPKRRGL